MRFFGLGAVEGGPESLAEQLELEMKLPQLTPEQEDYRNEILVEFWSHPAIQKIFEDDNHD